MPYVPSLVLARDLGGCAWFPVIERKPPLLEPLPLAKWLNMLAPTGSRVMLGQYEAMEYAVAFSHPDQQKGRYLAWTGRIWFIPLLPDSAGIQGLPGSPFAGRSAQFAHVWQTIGWDLNGRGLIVRADLTLHDGLTEEQVLLLQGQQDPAHMAQSDHGHQTVSIRVGNLVSDQAAALAAIFPDLAPVSMVQWPYDLPPQTVDILERY